VEPRRSHLVTLHPLNPPLVTNQWHVMILFIERETGSERMKTSGRKKKQGEQDIRSNNGCKYIYLEKCRKNSEKMSDFESVLDPIRQIPFQIPMYVLHIL
jgi:hypothetical protein